MSRLSTYLTHDELGKLLDVLEREGVTPPRVRRAILHPSANERLAVLLNRQPGLAIRLDMAIDCHSVRQVLSTRTRNCLMKEYARVTSCHDLLAKSAEELMLLRNFGVGSLKEVERLMALLEFSLPSTPAEWKQLVLSIAEGLSPAMLFADHAEDEDIEDVGDFVRTLTALDPRDFEANAWPEPIQKLGARLRQKALA